ncbi:hypothetical protein AALP_AA7G134300 [Arabis alpina]|uniref:Uncharacterized protein n=1 Tax=Arabis alpina TaxID=50452 RepID=A0A087GHT5_ARAAL|nr:hypothetical protein AALP_AA7G134300 [Arabis alpina]
MENQSVDGVFGLEPDGHGGGEGVVADVVDVTDVTGAATDTSATVADITDVVAASSGVHVAIGSRCTDDLVLTSGTDVSASPASSNVPDVPIGNQTSSHGLDPSKLFDPTDPMLPPGRVFFLFNSASCSSPYSRRAHDAAQAVSGETQRLYWQGKGHRPRNSFEDAESRHISCGCYRERGFGERRCCPTG